MDLRSELIFKDLKEIKIHDKFKVAIYIATFFSLRTNNDGSIIKMIFDDNRNIYKIENYNIWKDVSK